jgi:phospholipid N-methyltransferase
MDIKELVLQDTVEMSRYINIAKYHEFEIYHPFYKEMVRLIIKKIKEHAHVHYTTRILEVGAGTGIFTKYLSQLRDVEITAIEPDKNCVMFLHNTFASKKNVKIVQDNAITFKPEHTYDMIISTFSHHHIPPTSAAAFLQNMHSSLRENGVYIVGDELVSHYTNEQERKISLLRYHSTIVYLAKQFGYPDVAELEIQSLLSGIYQIGEFKRSAQLFEEEMGTNEFTIVDSTKLGPHSSEDIGGVYVYTFMKN